MKRFFAWFALFSAAMVLPAQQSTGSFSAATAGAATAGMEGLGTQSTVLQFSPMAMGCPVFLHAQHGVGGQMLNVDGKRVDGAQLLHLTLANPDGKQIVAARVRAHGLSGKGRISQAAADPGEADSVATMNVRFRAGSGKEVTSNLRIPGMTAVLSVDLLSVTFADGGQRTFAASDGCRFQPDPLMLISNR